MLLFPTQRSVKSDWESEISRSGSIYTTEIGQQNFLFFFFPPRQLIVKYLLAYHTTVYGWIDGWKDK